MKSFIKVTKPAVPATEPAAPIPVAVAPIVTLLAEAVEKKEDVAGVPGTKAESGHYGGGYIACPACKLTYKLEDKHFVDPKAEDEQPENTDDPTDKPKDKPSPKDEGKSDDTGEPKQPEDKAEDKEPEKKALTFEAWRDETLNITKKAKTGLLGALLAWSNERH